MFSKILGKNKEQAQEDSNHTAIVEKVAKMNLSDMRVYVNNKLNDFEICSDGLNEVMRKLVSRDANNKRLIESDAMDSKIKKAFDLVVIIGSSTKVTIITSELIAEFIETYKDLIKKFDTDNKQIYRSKLKATLVKTLGTIETMTLMNKKMKVLGK